MILALLMACSWSAPRPDVDPPHYIWVEQHFATYDGAEPPSTLHLLAAAGVGVQEVVVKELPRCMGPGCPTYSALHFAKIPQRDFDRATQLGFKPSGGPTD
jgi:hypothetical protein